MKNYLFVLLSFLPFLSISQTTHPVLVKAVHDGDSYKVKFQDTTFWIRIYGCDAPEVISNHVAKHQPYGLKASENVRQLIKGDTIYIDTLYRDMYDRLVCKVYLDSLSEQNLTDWLIKTGNAWWLDEPTMSKGTKSYLQALQQEATNIKVGLWSLSGRKLRPATWRSRNRRFSLEKEF